MKPKSNKSQPLTLKEVNEKVLEISKELCSLTGELAYLGNGPKRNRYHALITEQRELATLQLKLVIEFCDNHSQESGGINECGTCRFYDKCSFPEKGNDKNPFLFCPRQDTGGQFLFVTEIKRKKLRRAHLN